MSWVAWAMMGIAALVVFALIPGVQHAVKPLVGALFDFATFVAANMWNWTFWFFKSVLSAHADLYRHLTHTAEEIDPSRKMEE